MTFLSFINSLPAASSRIGLLHFCKGSASKLIFDVSPFLPSTTFCWQPSTSNLPYCLLNSHRNNFPCFCISPVFNEALSAHRQHSFTPCLNPHLLWGVFARNKRQPQWLASRRSCGPLHCWPTVNIFPDITPQEAAFKNKLRSELKCSILVPEGVLQSQCMQAAGSTCHPSNF